MSASTAFDPIVLQKIVPDCTLSVWKQDDARSYLAVEYDLEEYDSSDVEYLRCFKLKVRSQHRPWGEEGKKEVLPIKRKRECVCVCERDCEHE